MSIYRKYTELLAVCACPVFLLQCAGFDQSQDEEPARSPSLSERLNEQNGFTQDSDGNWVPRSDKRSSYESRGSAAQFQGEFSKSEYGTSAYQKKAWWGTSSYQAESYTGNTDGSRFQKQARQATQQSQFATQQATDRKTFQTNNLSKPDARESSVSQVPTGSDAETDVRRRVYKAPSVQNWKSQRNLSIDESKAALGR